MRCGIRIFMTDKSYPEALEKVAKPAAVEISNVKRNEQIKKLSIFLVEMFQGIVPENNGEYFNPIDQRFLDEMINDPLNLNVHEFHRTNLEYLRIDDGFPVAWRDEKGKVLFVQLRSIEKR